MAQKRAAKQAQEALENKANEAIKRKAAKVCSMFSDIIGIYFPNRIWALLETS